MRVSRIHVNPLRPELFWQNILALFLDIEMAQIFEILLRER